jgi:phosphopantetheinyl transferase
MNQFFFIEYQHITNFSLNDLKIYSDSWCEKIADKSRKKESLLARFLLNKLCIKQFQKTIFECGFKKNEFGKPYFEEYPELNVSITHSHGYAWVAVSSSPIGIDFEKVELDKSEDLKIAFDSKDWDFVSDNSKLIYQYFSLKESYAKMIGTGFTTDPAKIELKFLRKNSFYTSIKSAYASYVLTLTALDFDPNDYIKSDFIKLCCFESF